MTLSEFLGALNTDVQVTLVKDSETLIEFQSSGYASVESDILANVVSKWVVNGATSITVTIVNA